MKQNTKKGLIALFACVLFVIALMLTIHVSKDGGVSMIQTAKADSEYNNDDEEAREKRDLKVTTTKCSAAITYDSKTGGFTVNIGYKGASISYAAPAGSYKTEIKYEGILWECCPGTSRRCVPECKAAS